MFLYSSKDEIYTTPQRPQQLHSLQKISDFTLPGTAHEQFLEEVPVNSDFDGRGLRVWFHLKNNQVFAILGE